MRAQTWCSVFLSPLLLPALAWGQDTAPTQSPEVFVKSFFPEKWEEGTTVEIYGSGFLPPSQGTNRVCLVGQLVDSQGRYLLTNEMGEAIFPSESGTAFASEEVETEDGEKAFAGTPFCFPATYSTPNRLLFTIDEAFITNLGKALDEEAEEPFELGIAQRTLRGGIYVEVETKSGEISGIAYPPAGSKELKRTILFPVNAQKAWRHWVRVAQASAAKTWLEEEVGITLVPGSMEIATVRPGSKAKRLGVNPVGVLDKDTKERKDGDLLYEINGQEVNSLREFGEKLAATEGTVHLTFWSESGEKRGSFNLLNYQPPPPPSILATLILLLAGTAVLLLWVAPFAGIITVIERKIGARMQSRVGPNRVGPQGFLQWLADGLKVMQKEDLIPDGADPILFRLAPYLMFIGMYGTFVVIPFSQWLVPSDLNVGLLYLIAVTALVVVALIMSGWASNSKWSLLGGMRAAAQMISYEIPTGLSLLTGIVIAGSLSMQDIIMSQGGAPWNWIIFRHPAAFASFFFFFTSGLAEANRPPFDLPEAESELVAGYNTEYSGFRFLAFWFAEYANYYILAAVGTAVFLGGWRIPGVSLEEQAGSLQLQLVGMALFMTKALVLVHVVIWLRWTLPRMRVDQLMIMCWKYLVPLTLFCFLFSAVWVLFIPPTSLFQQVASWALFLCGVGLVLAFIARARYNLRQAKAELYVNPFI